MSSIRPNAGAPQEDEVKRAADLREWLETKILELEDELNKHKEMLAIVDSVLRKTSFVPATELRNQLQQEERPIESPSTVKNPALNGRDGTTSSKSASQDTTTKKTSKSPVAPAQSVGTAGSGGAEQSRSLRRTKDGLLMANAFIAPDSITIVPASDVKLPQTTPPFQSFFINRILKGYESRDLEMSQVGTLQPSEVLRFEVTETDGHIEKITVRNYRDKSRLNEILNTVNWAFSRRLEKK
jgi:hypothetical protein